MDCDTLTDPANGQVSHPRTTLGQTATYSCNTGYNLVGDSTRMCQAMGWSGSAPTCQGMLSMCTCVYCGANIWVFPSVHVKLSTCTMYRYTRNPLCIDTQTKHCSANWVPLDCNYPLRVTVQDWASNVLSYAFLPCPSLACSFQIYYQVTYTYTIYFYFSCRLWHSE